MKGIDVSRFRVRPGMKVRLDDWPTDVEPVYRSKSDYERRLAEQVERLRELQERHYADNRYALLVVFQAMDAAGKDGAIEHVMSGVNPQGCQVFSFKHPSASELEHDFLWRTTLCLPERGRIGIFNRSHYEEVLIVRVHPEILRGEGLPPDDGSFTSPRKSSGSDFSSASTIRGRTGSSAWVTSTSGDTGVST
jgi:polyphosphate kinase 2 (PPK2 family)